LLIPRWRSFEKTMAAGELSSRKGLKSLDVTSPVKDELGQKSREWHVAPSEFAAQQLVDCAVIHGQEDVASAAAQFLASVQADVTPMIRRQSQQLLSRLGKAVVEPTRERSPLRALLREHPDDPILWVELSLRQVISGSPESAVRSMRAALQLAPDNRFVLRSAARLFSHLREPDVGYHYLRKSSVTEYDPWLMSAEIALASGIGRRGLFLQKGLRLLDGGDGEAKLELSELAGAAASTYFQNAVSRKQAKRLFSQSVAVPTDSAIAQAEWASQAAGERFLKESTVLENTRAKEALALHAFNSGDYPLALKAAREWIEEERFSARAHITAAAAANTMDDYQSAIEISTEGIWFDPKSPHLRNSLIFALASSDQLATAEHEVLELQRLQLDALNEQVLFANEGLIALRRGRLADGEALYRRAISGFRKTDNDYLAVSALAYFSREAMLAGHPRASELLRELKAKMPAREHRVATRLLRQVTSLAEERQHSG
jgi:Tfp pilus assembly protein PilF